MNTTNEQDSDHDNPKKPIGHRPRPTARPVDDGGHDSYVGPENHSPARGGTGSTTEDDTVGEVTQPRVGVMEYCRELYAPDGKQTNYRPTTHECRQLATYWVGLIVSVEAEWVFAQETGSTEIGLESYAMRKLSQMLELGILREGELNHVLYLERVKKGLKHDDGGSYGDGTIEHPKWWLEELETMKHRKTNGLSVPKEWEPFIEDVDGETDAENGSPPITKDTSETGKDV
jgi:hypothetical protein